MHRQAALEEVPATLAMAGDGRFVGSVLVKMPPFPEGYMMSQPNILMKMRSKGALVLRVLVK